jgi:hypothetical protein
MKIGFSRFSLAALEALRVNHCISGYTNEQGQLRFDWLPGGADRAFEELTSNPSKPFGLTPAARGSLVNLLPDDKKEKFYKLFLDGLGDLP